MAPLKIKTQAFIAAGMLVGFFLPWAQIWGFGVSGYNLAQLGSYGNWAWAILLSSIITIVVFSTNQSAILERAVAYITGALPIIGLAIGMTKIGTEMFHVISVGVYICLVAGAALIFVTASQYFTFTQSFAIDRRETVSPDRAAEDGGQTKRCTSCNQAVMANFRVCPTCGGRQFAYAPGSGV